MVINSVRVLLGFARPLFVQYPGFLDIETRTVSEQYGIDDKNHD